EPTSSQFPKSYLDPEGDILLLEALLNDDHSSDFKTKSSSTSLNSLLEETNNFHNSLPEFTTFSNVLFDAEYESDSNLHLDNAESALMESLRTHDSSLLISSKIDSLLDEFAEFVSAKYDAAIESFSPSPILVKDIDYLMEEIDLFCTPDYPMPPGIKDDDYDSERDIIILKDLPSNNTLSFLKKSHSILIFFRFLVLMQNHQMEKSPDILSHRCLKAFQPSTKCLMMIHGQNNPIFDVLMFYFYPLDQP
nr:hypothetical protein [Tanacetum cinerariifolium]